jgi:hypothetical protein
VTRTFIRQDFQIRSSDVFDDTIAPTEAAFETNPTVIEEDLNNIRSMLSHLLDVQAGNWWDVIGTPSALEAGTQRGVSNLNDALHAVEKKRVLRCVQLLADVTTPTGANATGVLTGTANFADTETVTIDSKVYTFQATLTDVDGNVQLGGSLSASLQNLRDAIDITGTPGTQYAASMTLHPTVEGTANDATTLSVQSKQQGTQFNSIATTEGAANASWGAATLQGGAGDVVILGAGELPSQTTAAVGAVTTLGTVVATATAFGTSGLDEVAGLHALAPKNLLEIVDGTTGDPILSTEGKRVWGLMQGESGLTDGSTITDTTTTRVQITFVHANATNDDLIVAHGEDTGGKTINYCYVERVRLEDLNESDFLNSAAIDIGAGAVTPTRQLGYDNQGTTPVDLVTNAILDLEGAGLSWTVRDDLEAMLFQIVEGSAGGTSQVNLGSDVDEFDVDAQVNNFDQGVSMATGKTRPIDVGVTDGVIESTAGDLMVKGAAELLFDDVNQTGSTWAQDGIKLSETTAEWDAFEAAFGEVSLLAAIVDAGGAPDRRRVQAVVTVNVAADADVSGPANDNNLDVDLGDLSAGTFVTDYDIYVNGKLQRNGANAAANEDVYPGTSLANGQLKFEFNLKGGGSPDVITVIDWAS